MKKIVVLTGAGISAESGISTFRDSDGLWEHYRVEDVATHEAYERNPELVLDFYNQRRRQLFAAQPNEAHRQLVRLEEKYDVRIVTQNIDDLHERAGSSHVLHLHGELTKGRSDRNPDLIVEVGNKDIVLGDKAPDGTQLRPHIIWYPISSLPLPFARRPTSSSSSAPRWPSTPPRDSSTMCGAAYPAMWWTPKRCP